ncbi:IS630 family transposase, partial [Psychrobacter sp. Sarcosine-02u-2]
PKGRHAVVVMDGALWHQPSLNQANVTMLKLPPYSPELNPSERV